MSVAVSEFKVTNFVSLGDVTRDGVHLRATTDRRTRDYDYILVPMPV